jgi:uncharacterized protein
MANQTKPKATLKHVPQRMCIVCRETAGKRTLIRLVRTAEGVQVDPKGKTNGRGAYLCTNPTCWARVASSDVLEKALRMTISAEEKARLGEALHTIKAGTAS